MKVLISADMEGVTGVTSPDDCRPGHSRWEYCRRFLTDDVNAAIAGFADAGATQIIVNEAHADQRNLLLDRLDDRASLLIGNHKPLGMMEGLQGKPDAVAFVGYHTAAGEAGVLAHTYLPNTLTRVRVNGDIASEGLMNALLAREFGVPVVLVTGDDLTCADASRYAPAAGLAAVKTCVDRYSAICLPPSVSGGLISGAAREGLAAIGPVEPVVGPFTYELSFDAAQLAPLATHIPGVTQVDDLSIAFTLDTMYDAIRCFRAVTRLVTSGIEPTYG